MPQLSWDIPLQNYTGTIDLPQRNLPPWVKRVVFRLQRNTGSGTIWPNESTTVAAQFEASWDGGATWESAGAFTAAGGVAINSMGDVIPETIVVIPYPGRDAEWRASFTVTNGPCRTQGSIVAEG